MSLVLLAATYRDHRPPAAAVQTSPSTALRGGYARPDLPLIARSSRLALGSGRQWPVGGTASVTTSSLAQRRLRRDALRAAVARRPHASVHPGPKELSARPSGRSTIGRQPVTALGPTHLRATDPVREIRDPTPPGPRRGDRRSVETRPNPGSLRGRRSLGPLPSRPDTPPRRNQKHARSRIDPGCPTVIAQARATRSHSRCVDVGDVVRIARLG